MTPERWRAIHEVFAAASGLDGAAREAFLADRCAGDDELRREIERLLQHDDKPSLAAPLSAGADLLGKLSLSGQTISHYEVLEELGAGGMGVVYKAEDLKLKRTVALKFLRSDLIEDPEHRERFLREAQAAAALDHPNICTVHEIDEVDGETFISMAFIEGQTVKDKIAERPLKLEEALDIAVQTAQGLQAAHEKGVVHRDI